MTMNPFLSCHPSTNKRDCFCNWVRCCNWENFCRTRFDTAGMDLGFWSTWGWGVQSEKLKLFSPLGLRTPDWCPLKIRDPIQNCFFGRGTHPPSGLNLFSPLCNHVGAESVKTRFVQWKQRRLSTSWPCRYLFVVTWRERELSRHDWNAHRRVCSTCRVLKGTGSQSVVSIWQHTLGG